MLDSFSIKLSLLLSLTVEVFFHRCVFPQVIVAVGALLDLFWLMEIGRFVFG